MLKRSLLSKLLVGMLLSAIVPLAVFVVISYETTSDSVQRQVIDLNRQAMNSSMYYLKRYLDDLDQTSVALYFDPVLMGYLRSTTSAYDKRIYLTNQVYAISRERSELRAVRFTHTNTGEVFASSSFLQRGVRSELGTASSQGREGDGWTETHGYEVLALADVDTTVALTTDANSTDVSTTDASTTDASTTDAQRTVDHSQRLLAFHKPIVDYPRSTLLGMLSLYIGPEEFSRILRPFAGSDAMEGEQVFLFIRRDRQLLYASEPTSTADTLAEVTAAGEFGSYGHREGTWKGQAGVLIYTLDAYKGIPLTLVKFIPATVVNEAANQALRQALVIPLLLIGVVLVSAFVLFYLLISPIKRLVRSVAHVQSGNFEMQPAPERQDELGVLEHRFHAMVRGLDDLMNREYRNRLELSTARLKMLQAQINPHFLYNALQSISTLALRQGAHDVNDKLAELGSIMRYSMDISTETVPLQKEIEHIENYLSLQSERFRSRLSYTLVCPLEARQLKVPKMVLQPLVENSIIHGIEKGSGSGAIQIAIALSGERLMVRVTDNGRGMTAETIADLRKAFGSKSAGGTGAAMGAEGVTTGGATGVVGAVGAERGIGLLNVLERLRLAYGEAFSWRLESRPYVATEIELRIAGIALDWDACGRAGKDEFSPGADEEDKA